MMVPEKKKLAARPWRIPVAGSRQSGLAIPRTEELREQSLSGKTDIIDGWSVRPTEDARFGVFDNNGGLLAGPFAAREEAMLAALSLPPRATPSGGTEPPRPAGFTPKAG